jgi:hypothetical protein
MLEGPKASISTKVIEILHSIQEPGSDITSLITYLNGLTVLDLNEANLCSIDIKNLCAALTYNRSITDLNLEKNYIDEKDVIYICTMLTRNSTLMKLDLRINRLGGKGISALANNLANIPRDMSKFILLAQNNGLSNISDQQEMDFWKKVFIEQQRRFDERRANPAIVWNYPSCTSANSRSMAPMALAQIGARICLRSLKPVTFGS